MTLAIALFGEAEKGQYRRGMYCSTLAQLAENFGHPPPESHGLHFAIQSLMLERDIVFFRVREEGYAVQDYIKGLHKLRQDDGRFSLSAIALPGVGDSEVIGLSTDICLERKSVLITTEADLYDYLTSLSCREI